MGQTLTHGVYLPAEGERNCYDGLASNWSILDNSVGTIAEHTTALAGKAPAVHTHTKSDVTDLLNSNFIPSANNSYDLGSSSYQWNNVYAKNYYYNGTAWGLDKDNTWSQINDFKTLRLYGVAGNNLVMYPPSGDKGDSSTFGFNIICSDKNLGNYAASGVANIGMGQSGGTSYVALNASTKGSTDNNIHSIQIGLQIAAADNANIGSFYPTQNGGINLGTSTNKWKSFNGINPGALSLPDTLGTSGTENVNYFNVIGYLNNTGTIASIPSTATYDGWLYINAKDGADSYIIIDDSPASFGTSVFGNNGLGSQSIGLLCLMCPIRKGHAYNVRIKSAGIVSARIYPAQGNV